MIDPSLLNFISERLKQGASEDEIRRELLAKNWSEQEIRDALAIQAHGSDIREQFLALRSELVDIKRMLSLHTERISRLERKPSAVSGEVPAPGMPPAEVELPPPPPPPPPPSVVPGAGEEAFPLEKPLAPSMKPASLEEKLGGNWLVRVGVAALVFGVGFFLKWAFDNNWIGPRGQVMLGMLGGLALAGAGEYWQERFKVYARILTGGGIAVLYLTIFAAYAFLDLIGAVPAFAFMTMVTVAAGALALRYEAVTIATIGVLGGFFTPLFLFKELANEFILLGYTAVLDLGILGLASVRNWRPLTLIGLVGSLLLFGAWSVQVDVQEKLGLAEGALTIFFLIFVGATTLYHVLWTRRPESADLALMVLNAASYFVISYALLLPKHEPLLGGFAIALAVFYGLLAYAAFSRSREHALLTLFLAGIALVFLTIAIPLQLESNWITIAWAVEGAILVWLGFSIASHHLRIFGLGVLIIMVVRLFAFDSSVDLTDFRLMLNDRFLTFFVGILSTYCAAYFYWQGRERIRGEEGRVFPVLLLAANFFTLWLLSAEAVSYFDSKIRAAQGAILEPDIFDPSSTRKKIDHDAIRGYRYATNFALSFIWATYAIALIAAGIAKRMRLLRITALVLFWITIFKVFLFDMSGLSEGYRVASFMSLGVILVTTGFLYNRYSERIKEFLLSQEEGISGEKPEANPQEPQDEVNYRSGE